MLPKPDPSTTYATEVGFSVSEMLPALRFVTTPMPEMVGLQLS